MAKFQNRNVRGIRGGIAPGIVVGKRGEGSGSGAAQAITLDNLGQTLLSFNSSPHGGNTFPTSVTNSDGSLTISPTTGVIIASLNIAHANIWSAAQRFNAAITYGGVTLNNAVTGTGSMVLATSPTLVTPVLGAASGTSLNLSAGLTIGAPAVLKGYTVATLPAAQATGSLAYVTDALTPAIGVALTGGGATYVLALYNGTNWIAC